VIILKKSISVVGGDLRIVKLIGMLVEDGYTVYTYGLEQSEELLSTENVEMCPTVEEVISASEVVIGPIPVTSDRKNLSMPFSNIKLPVEEFISKLSCKAFIAGTISEDQRKILEEKAAERRAERKEQMDKLMENGEVESFAVSATGTDIKSVTQNFMATVSGISAPTGAGFDIKA